MKHRASLVASAALALAFAASLPVAFAATPILEYKFNGDTAGTGSVTTSLTLENSASIGAAGTGVSGVVGDNALNLTAAGGMGSIGIPVDNAPRASIASRPIEVNVLTSFTIQGWFKTDGVLIGSNANIFTVNGNMSLIATGSGVISLNVDGTSRASTTGGYNTNSAWTFFAMTYDGTETTANVKFYVGNTSTEVTQLGATATNNSGTVGSTSGLLALGNSAGGNRGFDGFLDNIRLFGSKTDATGVLTLGELETIRFADATAVPEPASSATLLAGFAVVAACLRRRSRQVAVRA